jgi:GT2 family glycosyltransferase
MSAEKIRLVCATRLSNDAFFIQTALGRSVVLYQTIPVPGKIELRLFQSNTQGLSAVFNAAIEEARADPAILVFIHDDLFLCDFYWPHHLLAALQHFDVVGLAGNKRRVPGQPSWMYLDEQLTRDDFANFSGIIGHGDGFPNLRELSVYGEPGQEVKLLDGVMLAARSQTLIEHGLSFDARFTFDFYDLDFCRQAELSRLRMGTWAISAIHQSGGHVGCPSWREAYEQYLKKYGESDASLVA